MLITVERCREWGACWSDDNLRRVLGSGKPLTWCLDCEQASESSRVWLACHALPVESMLDIAISTTYRAINRAIRMCDGLKSKWVVTWLEWSNTWIVGNDRSADSAMSIIEIIPLSNTADRNEQIWSARWSILAAQAVDDAHICKALECAAWIAWAHVKTHDYERTLQLRELRAIAAEVEA